MSVIERIISCLNDKGHKQIDLAEALKDKGVTKQTITDWKNGRSNTYYELIADISAFLSVSTDYLLKGVEPQMQNIIEGEISGTAIMQNDGNDAVTYLDRKMTVREHIEGSVTASNWYDLSDEEKSEIRLRISKLSEYVDEIPEDDKIPSEKKDEVKKYLGSVR